MIVEDPPCYDQGMADAFQAPTPETAERGGGVLGALLMGLGGLMVGTGALCCGGDLFVLPSPTAVPFWALGALSRSLCLFGVGGSLVAGGHSLYTRGVWCDRPPELDQLRAVLAEHGPAQGDDAGLYAGKAPWELLDAYRSIDRHRYRRTFEQLLVAMRCEVSRAEVTEAVEG